jgi:hypothetical protein
MQHALTIFATLLEAPLSLEVDSDNNPMPPKKVAAPAKGVPTIPKRKKEGASPFTKKKKNVPTLTVHSFSEPLGLEAYICEQREGNDGHLKGVEDVLGDKLTCDYFTKALFYRVANRRVPKSPTNEILTFSDPKKSKIWRKIIIRCPEGGTSPASHEEGLKIAKKFLMDENFTDCPPSDIVTRDATEPDDLPSLDQFFLDTDIKRILQQELHENILNCTFFESYPDFAAKCWSGATDSSHATSLGFPNL